MASISPFSPYNYLQRARDSLPGQQCGASATSCQVRVRKSLPMRQSSGSGYPQGDEAVPLMAIALAVCDRSSFRILEIPAATA
jgi:hypothetical protein